MVLRNNDTRERKKSRNPQSGGLWHAECSKKRGGSTPRRGKGDTERKRWRESSIVGLGLKSRTPKRPFSRRNVFWVSVGPRAYVGAKKKERSSVWGGETIHREGVFKKTGQIFGDRFGEQGAKVGTISSRSAEPQGKAKNTGKKHTKKGGHGKRVDRRRRK